MTIRILTWMKRLRLSLDNLTSGNVRVDVEQILRLPRTAWHLRVLRWLVGRSEEDIGNRLKAVVGVPKEIVLEDELSYWHCVFGDTLFELVKHKNVLLLLARYGRYHEKLVAGLLYLHYHHRPTVDYVDIEYLLSSNFDFHTMLAHTFLISCLYRDTGDTRIVEILNSATPIPDVAFPAIQRIMSNSDHTGCSCG